MKKLQIVSAVVLTVTLLIMAVNLFITPLPDWIVRTDGIAMMIMLAVTAYSTIRGFQEKREM